MAETKTFEQMQTIAQAIDPRATVHLNYDRTWEITIPTDFEETYELGAQFAGTAAAEAHSSIFSGETELERWARKNYHGSEPLEIAARWFNLEHSKRVGAGRAFDAALIERGLPTIMETNFKALTPEEYAAFKALREEVVAGLEPGWKAEEQALYALSSGE